LLIESGFATLDEPHRARLRVKIPGSRRSMGCGNCLLKLFKGRLAGRFREFSRFLILSVNKADVGQSDKFEYVAQTGAGIDAKQFHNDLRFLGAFDEGAFITVIINNY
jgi:hypothetical protein